MPSYNFNVNSIKYYSKFFLCIAIIIIGAQSCAVKNAPKQPFVYNNKIIVTGNVTKEENKRLTQELQNYWDDSMKVKRINSFKIKNPAVFDSLSLERSKIFMNNYLRSQGYYYVTFKKDSIIKNQVKDQIRVTPIVTINLGKNITIDSVSFALSDSNLQKIAFQNIGKSFLRKGVPYTKQVVSSELDRLTALFRQNGYYGVTRDDFYALIDTTDSKLLQLTFDPFEQAKLLAAFEASKKENPKWDIAIKQSGINSSIKSTPFIIGNTYYYTQAKPFAPLDSIINYNWKEKQQGNGFVVLFNKKNIDTQPLLAFNYLKKDSLYNENLFYKSLNNYSKLGTFKQVDAKFTLRGKDTLDVHYKMVPDKKYSIENTGEFSRNIGDVAAGNLLGISTSVTFRNRNVWKKAVQSFTSVRAGLELTLVDTARAIQTFFGNINHTYSFPRFLGENFLRKLSGIAFFRKMVESDNKRTLVSLSGNYSDRFGIFKLRSFTTNAAWEWKNGNNLWLIRPLNVELYNLEKLDGLDELIRKNPFLILSFNTGNVVGNFNFTYFNSHNSTKRSNVSHYVRVAFEESGAIAGMFKGLQNSVFRYAKVEAEYRHNIKYLKSEFTYRNFVGIGINYGPNNDIGKVLPFFKQFSLGGPNSMRAWGIRQLGQGSSLLSDTALTSFKDRFGDVVFETNLEYRFNVAKTSFVTVGSAIYADIGNVWNLKQSDNNANGEFNFSRLYRDLAVGVGTGLRLDFSYFLIRLDVAYKLKDPARQYNDGWLDIKNSGLREKRANGVEVRNYAFQLGIGMPF
jgi:outer membrane protein insertion porin family